MVALVRRRTCMILSIIVVVVDLIIFTRVVPVAVAVPMWRSVLVHALRAGAKLL